MIKREKSLKNSLLLMIFLSVAFSVVITGTIVSFNFYLDYKKSLQSNILEVGEKIKGDIERMYQLGLTFNDLPGFESDIKKVLNDENIISYIIVCDKNGLVQASTIENFKNKIFKKNQDERVRINKEDSLNFIINIMGADKSPVYTINLGLRESILNEKIFVTLVTLVVICVFIVAFVFAIMKTFLENRLIEPLLKLKSGTDMVARGQLNVTINAIHNDEVGALTENFVKMVKEIKEIVLSIKEGTKKLSSVSDIVETLSHNVKDGSGKQLKSTSHIQNLFADLEGRINVLKGKVNSLNDFIELTTSTFLELSSSSDEIFRTMEELLKSVEKVEDAYKKINQINENIDKGAEVRAKVVENILSFVSQMDSAIKMTFATVSETSKVADKMDVLAKESKQSINDTIRGIGKIALASKEAKSAFNMLKNSIGKVSNILNVIEEITEQTNMLALNAAIIAAQSEEGGTAFSVVADEIKELSRKTKASTKEITELISVIMEQTEMAFEKIQENAHDSEVVEKNSKDIEQKITEIITLISVVTAGVKEILKASNEQAQGSSTLRVEAETLNNLSKEFRNLRDEGRKGSKNLGYMVDFITDVASKVGSSVKEQTEAISKIKSSVIDLSGFSKDMLEHIQSETEEINATKPVLSGIQKLSHDNDVLASKLDEKLNELKEQITKFKEVTSRFVIEE